MCSSHTPLIACLVSLLCCIGDAAVQYTHFNVSLVDSKNSLFTERTTFVCDEPDSLIRVDSIPCKLSIVYDTTSSQCQGRAPGNCTAAFRNLQAYTLWSELDCLAKMPGEHAIGYSCLPIATTSLDVCTPSHLVTTEAFIGSHTPLDGSFASTQFEEENQCLCTVNSSDVSMVIQAFGASEGQNLTLTVSPGAPLVPSFQLIGTHLVNHTVLNYSEVLEMRLAGDRLPTLFMVHLISLSDDEVNVTCGPVIREVPTTTPEPADIVDNSAAPVCSLDIPCQNGRVCTVQSDFNRTAICLCPEGLFTTDCEPNVAIIVGVSVGGGVVLLCLVIGLCCCFKRSSRSQSPKKRRHLNYPTPYAEVDLGALALDGCGEEYPTKASNRPEVLDDCHIYDEPSFKKISSHKDQVRISFPANNNEYCEIDPTVAPPDTP